MPQVDDAELDALSLPELYERAMAAGTAGRASLIEARRLYSRCLLRQLDIYEQAKLRKQLWEVEKRLGLYPQYFSQAGQDRFIHRTFFRNKKFGIFVEVGGYNGWEGSNCFFFETMRRWSGVIVEASPRLVREIAETRVAEVVHAALSNRDGSAEFIEVTAGFTQMGGLVGDYTSRRLKILRGNPKHQERIVTVPTMRLERLLREHDFDHVDYCSIDVEGAERSILTDFDFAAFDITVLSVENNLRSAAGTLRDILEPAGYRLITVIGADEIYRKK